MTQTDKRIEFFRKISKLIIMASIHEIKLLPTSFMRTAEEQKKLFDAGKSKCDGTNLISNHQKGLAIDFVIVRDRAIWINDPEYKLLGQMWEEEGMTWGGNFKTFPDIFHFEWKDPA